MEKLLSTVIQLKASDIHISVGQPPVVRHHGRMRKLDAKVLDSDDTTALMKSITPDRCQQELQQKGGADFAIAFGEGTRFRCSIFKQKGFIGMVLRRIPSQFLTFEQIGMPEAVPRLITRPRGLLLVTGPTGSGKTTSLASMINFLNDNYDRHIITLEDPIEYFHKHKKSTVNQREIGIDVPDFKEGLRRALRMDPDVILVGEMRDLETIESALRIAETGHLTLATLHTNSAASTINRIIDVFPSDQQAQIRAQLSLVLEGILCQALLPRAEGSGRAMALEILVPNGAIRNLIREDKIHQIYSAMQSGQDKFGMQTFNQSLATSYFNKLITLETALQRSSLGQDQPWCRAGQRYFNVSRCFS